MKVIREDCLRKVTFAQIFHDVRKGPEILLFMGNAFQKEGRPRGGEKLGEKSEGQGSWSRGSKSKCGSRRRWTERQRSRWALMVNSGFIPRVMEPLQEFKHESERI